jgi:S-DNA-T family DNA segregation ATPase FtsK/SpoIIIE
MVLSQRKVTAAVTPLFDGPQVQTYQVRLAIGEEPEKVERLAGALAMAAGADQCRVARAHGHLLVEVPKAESRRGILLSSRLAAVDRPTPLHVPLGVGSAGRVVWLDLADERLCHLVIGGTTQSGKTNALLWILRCLLGRNARGRLQLLLANPKRERKLEPFERSRHLMHPVVYNLLDIVRVLVWLEGEMERRGEQGVTQPRIVMAIDEVRQLVRREARIRGLLSSLAEMGAGVGIHLLVGTQQPGARALGEALTNFPARLLGRVASATLSYGAAGRKRSQAEALLGRGDMLLIGEGGLMHRVQVPLVGGECGDIPVWSAREQVHRLDLPAVVDWAVQPGVDRRGGWNRKQLDLEQVRADVLDGATATDLQEEYGINYNRAEGLVQLFGGDDEG